MLHTHHITVSQLAMMTLLWSSLIAALTLQWPICGAGALSQPNTITDILGPLLSPNASIYLPGTEGFVNGTARWSLLDQPNVTAVVKVATEADVQQTVRPEHRSRNLTLINAHR